MSTASIRAALRLYTWAARFRRLNYQAKIMLMAFIGTHVPLLALAAWFSFQGTHDWDVLLVTLSVTLVATLGGTALTLLVLHHLLRPVTLTSKALRLFRTERQRMDLPTEFTDEVGTLMADAHQTLQELDRRMDTLEFVDQQTGLPNKRRFARLVQREIEKGKPFAVAVVRFANLTRIEDTVDGRRAETAARTMAERLAEEGAFGRHLSRVGPSKFACVLELQGEDSWAVQAARLRSHLDLCAGEIALADFSFAPRLHCGLATFPEDGGEAEALIDAAIAAAPLSMEPAPVNLYSAKARQAAMDQLRLEQDLRQALERQEFALHYQPVFDLQAGRAIGAEALVRWNHPERGVVPPGAFIAAAESSGLIRPLGLWVIREACAQLGRWNASGLPGLRMAVNVSARQFMDPALMDQLKEAVADAGISPAQLEIELTESVAMVDHAHTRRMFSALRSEGVGIAIDDFGTGYASMSYLRKLPFDKLKIDREFVTNVHGSRENQAICNALIELSGGLGLRILAEGTEQEAEVRYLAQHGCDLFQGYYFSKPVAADQFPGMLTVPTGLLSRIDIPLTGQAPLNLH